MTSLLDRPPSGRTARPPSRFPRSRPAAAHPAADRPRAGTGSPVVVWHGEPGPLREAAEDHVAAAGTVLVDAADSFGRNTALHLADALSLLVRDAPPAPPGRLLLLSLLPADAQLWRRALEAGVRALCCLPADSAQLLGLLGDALREDSGGLVIGVAGACGGAGASSLAARLAAASARRGPVVLVDADPLGGGLDALVEAPAAPGATWEDLRGIDAADGDLLREGLPRIDGVHLLVAGADPAPTPLQLDHALGALGRTSGTVVVDLSPDHVGPALPHLDVLYLVLPTTDHALRAAWRRLAAWRVPLGSTQVILRGRGPVTAHDVREDLRLPVAGAFRDSPRSHVPLLDVRRSGADALARCLVTDLSGAGS